MKNLFTILLLGCTVFALTANNAHAQKKFLNAAEVSSLFTDKTMKVRDENRGSKRKNPETYSAYSSEMGGMLAKFDNGSRKTWSWSVDDEGELCIRRTARRHSSGLTCGFIYKENNGVYKMYNAKHAYKQNGKMVEGKHIELIATFSSFKKGNVLKK